MSANQKRKIRGWQKLVILLVILAAALAVYAGLNKYNSEKAKEEIATTTILSVKKTQVLSFSYQLQGIVYTFDRENSKSDWVYRQDPSVALDQDLVNGMLSAAVNVSTDRIIAENMDNAQEYGLDHPQFTVSMTLKDGSVKTILMGLQNSMTSDYYAAVEEDGRIFTLNPDFYSSFTTIDQLTAAATQVDDLSSDN